MPLCYTACCSDPRGRGRGGAWAMAGTREGARQKDL